MLVANSKSLLKNRQDFLWIWKQFVGGPQACILMWNISLRVITKNHATAKVFHKGVRHMIHLRKTNINHETGAFENDINILFLLLVIFGFSVFDFQGVSWLWKQNGTWFNDLSSYHCSYSSMYYGLTMVDSPFLSGVNSWHVSTSLYPSLLLIYRLT